MYMGMTQTKTWHVVRDDGRKVCGSAGDIVDVRSASINVGDKEGWFCAKCEWSPEVSALQTNVIIHCAYCSEGLDWKNRYSHRHFYLTNLELDIPDDESSTV